MILLSGMLHVRALLGDPLREEVSMKIKNIVTILLLGFILVSCSPAATVVPTGTTAPTSTATSIPPTATITPTPAPENLADAKDLSKWVNNYVHAFGGKVAVNGVDMDAGQLAEEVRKNPEAFILLKQINGVEYLFFLVNDFPLAMRVGKGQWEEMTSRKIIELNTRPEDTLKYIGAQFSNPFEVNTTSQVDDLIGNEFNAAFLNDAYWHVVEQREGHPDFTNALDAAHKAKEKGMFVIGGQLVDPAGEFDYTYLKNKKNLTRDELLSIMKTHIKAEVEALGDTVDAYVVVNESKVVAERYFGDPNRAWDQFNEIIGEDYIEEAFQTAREANPNAILLYNDGFNFQAVNGFSNGSNNTRRTLEIVNRLKARGLIDGVGLQMHMRTWEAPNISEMIRTFQNYGIPVYVTEFEIDASNSPGTAAEKEQTRLKLRKEVLEAMLKSGVVVSISHWTALDDDSGNKGQLFDAQLAPTAALFIERLVLFEYFVGK